MQSKIKEVCLKIKEYWQEILIRALKTFLQAFLSAILIDVHTLLTVEFSLWKPIFISALAAGISAVMNMAIVALSKDKY